MKKKRKKLIFPDNYNLPLFMNYIVFNEFTKVDEKGEGKNFFSKNEKMNHNNYYYATKTPISSLIDLVVLEEKNN